MDNLAEKLQRYFDDDNMYVTSATQFKKDDDYDCCDASGFMVYLTVCVPSHLSEEDARTYIDDNIGAVYYVGNNCGHSHDCCGCVFTRYYNTIIEKGVN